MNETQTEAARDALGGAGLLALSAVEIALIIGIAILLHRVVMKRLAEEPGSNFRSQLLALGLGLTALIAMVVVLPIGDALRGQLLGFLGILLSAVIALSSTTFVGNVMAGAMLRVIKSCRPGSYVEIGDNIGRISEMDLFHCEIQTEERDLVTLPNLYMVTNPMRVLRSSGTIITVQVSLGYDVPRTTIEKLLLEAAEQAELTDAFVQTRELGDFSVTYRVCGLLTDLSKLIATRSRLRNAVMDSLHGGGVEIVSPTFMNQRPQQPGEKMIPKMPARAATESTDAAAPDAVVFDKAVEAESIEGVREKYEAAKTQLAELEVLLKDASDDNVKTALEGKIEQVKQRIERWRTVIQSQEEKLSEKD